MPKKNRRQNHNHGSAPYINQKRSAVTAAQKQTVTVPCRQVVNIKFGQTSQDLTFAYVAEQGILSNVYGHDGSTYF
jgi:hypothetical protein